MALGNLVLLDFYVSLKIPNPTTPRLIHQDHRLIFTSVLLTASVDCSCQVQTHYTSTAEHAGIMFYDFPRSLKGLWRKQQICLNSPLELSRKRVQLTLVTLSVK